MSLVRVTTNRTLVRVSAVLPNQEQAAVHVHTTPTHHVRVSLAGWRALTELFTALVYEFQGGGIPITPGQEINVNDFPFPCRIIGWRLTSDVDAQTAVQLSRSDFGEYPTFVPYAGPLVLDNVSKAEGADLTGVFSPGDMLKANVISNTLAKTLALTLRVVRLSSNG